MIDLILLALVAFTVADYTLGRANVHDNARLIIAVVFAVIVVLFKAGAV